MADNSKAVRFTLRTTGTRVTASQELAELLGESSEKPTKKATPPAKKAASSSGEK